MTKILIGVGVLVVFGGGAYYYTQSSQENSEQGEVMEPAESPEGNQAGPPQSGEASLGGEEGAMEENEGTMTDGHVIAYTDNGYSPSTFTISKGDTVTFKNESSRDMWPATAIHPSHTVYPGSGIGKCDTLKEANIFDACRRIAPGGEYAFMFGEAGEWNYHDHLRATNWGTITVTE